MNKISTYLEKYDDLWMTMSDYECFCMDIAMDVIDESNYYGADFSSNKKVMMIFFCGHSDCFQGIWIGNLKYKKILDQLPIYEIDLSCGDEKFQAKGNFKMYMTSMLNDFLDRYENMDIYYYYAVSALFDLNIFSDKILNLDDYVVKLS
jgi:hypothetical protein